LNEIVKVNVREKQNNKCVYKGARKMGGIIAWVVLGLIAGAIAKAIYPGHQGGGIFATMGLGILGAMLGGWVGQTFLGTGAASAGGGFLGVLPGIGSIVLAVIGASILIFLWGLLTRQNA
jgi:uncharacterized membrane protein YeaQ/YmgE (transglycosylase-associated protein family)